MSAHPPPVPPANRSDKGPGEPAAAPEAVTKPGLHPNKPSAHEQGRTGNTEVNTHNQGYQQDR